MQLPHFLQRTLFWTIASIVVVGWGTLSILTGLIASSQIASGVKLHGAEAVLYNITDVIPVWVLLIALIFTLTMRSVAKHNKQHAWTIAHDNNAGQVAMSGIGGTPTAVLQLQLDSDNFVPLFQTPVGSTVAVAVPTSSITSAQPGTQITCHLTDDYGQLVRCRLVGSQLLGEQTLQLELERLS